MIKNMIGYAANMNVSMRELVDPKILAQAMSVLKEKKMILFRGNEVSRDELEQLILSIGEPVPSNPTYAHATNFIAVVSAKPGQGDLTIGQRGWHADTTFRKQMIRCFAMYMRQACPARGTAFIKNEYVVDNIAKDRLDFWKNALIANTRNAMREDVDDAPFMNILNKDGDDCNIRFHQTYTRAFKDGLTGEEFEGEKKDELIEEFMSYVFTALDKHGYVHEYQDHDFLLVKNTAMMHNFHYNPEKKLADFRTLERIYIEKFHADIKI